MLCNQPSLSLCLSLKIFTGLALENFGNSSSKTRVFVLSGHVSSGSDLNAPLGQLLEPISSSETRDVKPGLERKSSNLGISGRRLRGAETEDNRQ